jgi:hypothetical protein
MFFTIWAYQDKTHGKKSANTRQTIEVLEALGHTMKFAWVNGADKC